jgi:hypothetical protein
MLVAALRRVGLAETEWAEYQVETIRLRLLKIAAQVRITDLDPLFEGLPLEERLRPGLGRFALLKESSRDKNFVPFSSIRCSAPQASQDHESRLPCGKASSETGTKKSEPTDCRATPREKGG